MSYKIAPSMSELISDAAEELWATVTDSPANPTIILRDLLQDRGISIRSEDSRLERGKLDLYCSKSTRDLLRGMLDQPGYHALRCAWLGLYGPSLEVTKGFQSLDEVTKVRIDSWARYRESQVFDLMADGYKEPPDEDFGNRAIAKLKRSVAFSQLQQRGLRPLDVTDMQELITQEIETVLGSGNFLL